MNAPIVLKNFVVVAAVPVAFTNVRFCNVELPVATRFASVAAPVVVRVASEVAPETFRLLEIARFVEVALVVVAFCAVKFWRVLEAFTSKFPRVARPELVNVVPDK